MDYMTPAAEAEAQSIEDARTATLAAERSIGLAIGQSLQTGGIAHLPWSEAREDALCAVPSLLDSAEDSVCVEAWGTEDDGAEWRIHLDKTP